MQTITIEINDALGVLTQAKAITAFPELAQSYNDEVLTGLMAAFKRRLATIQTFNTGGKTDCYEAALATIQQVRLQRCDAALNALTVSAHQHPDGKLSVHCTA